MDPQSSPDSYSDLNPEAQRASLLDRLEAERFDFLVIGGGITGAGIAREAARRGLSVALVEAGDFASGTSSRSSKLIHGGLRYLAMGDVALVRETALERKWVHRVAPHLAEPVWMLVPARTRAGLLKFRAGLATYEKLGAVVEADRHQSWSGEILEREEPQLDRERFPYACAYREYRTDDARLVLANLRGAAAEGAVTLNYASVESIRVESGKAIGAELRCAESGRKLFVRARCVVNAAGPWVEALRRLEDPSAAPRLRLSKGVHVVLPEQRLPVRHCVIVGTPDRRSIFVIANAGSVYIGTTDTPYDGPALHWPEIDLEDVSYLLDPVSRAFRCDPLVPEDCVGAWSGLRPLISEAGKAPKEISRRDEVWIGPAGVVHIAGGKLTGYRKMSERAVERAAEHAGLWLRALSDPDLPLPGGDFAGDLSRLASELRSGTPLPDEAAARLVRLYGGEAASVADFGATPLGEGAPVLAGEVDWAVRVDSARRLEDLIYRRTRAALYLHECRQALLDSAAERMGALLGWNRGRQREERDAVAKRMRSDLEFRS